MRVEHWIQLGAGHLLRGLLIYDSWVRMRTRFPGRSSLVCGGMGRPEAWGLAAFGQSGVETALEILRRELRAIIRQAGTTSVDKITRSYVVTRPY